MAGIGVRDGGVSSIAALTSGGVVAAAGRALFWYDAVGRQIATSVGDDIVRALCSVPAACSNTGPVAASVGNDGMLRTWTTGGVAAGTARASDGYVLSVAASSNGILGPELFTGAANGAVRRWSGALIPLQTVTPGAPGSSGVSSLCTLPEGGLAAVSDNTLFVWDRDGGGDATTPQATAGATDVHTEQIAAVVAMGFPEDDARQALETVGWSGAGVAAEWLADRARRRGLIAQLCAVGFDDESARAALDATGWGSVERAADRLLQQQ